MLRAAACLVRAPACVSGCHQQPSARCDGDTCKQHDDNAHEQVKQHIGIILIIYQVYECLHTERSMCHRAECVRMTSAVRPKFYLGTKQLFIYYEYRTKVHKKIKENKN